MIMSLPKLTESMIRASASAQSFQRGQEYYEGGAISNTAIQGNVLTGECEGTSAPYYSVRVDLDEGGVAAAYCTCPYEFGGYCKHVVALLLTYLHDPQQFAIRAEPTDLLADLDRDDLAALMTKLLRDRPELYDWVEAAISTPASKHKTRKSKHKTVDAEVYRRQIRGIVHGLDGLRMSEAYWHVGGLVGELRGVQDTAMKFLDAGDADTALEILLALADEGGHGIEHIDDSDGELGGYMNDLGQPLAEVILSLDLSAIEREKLIARLKKIAKYLDDYGMGDGMDVALQAAEQGWEDTPIEATLQSTIHSVPRDYDEEYEEESEEEDFDEDEDEGVPSWRPGYVSDLTEAKLNVLDRQGRIDEYLALCLKAGRHLRYALKLCDLDRTSAAADYAAQHLTSSEEALRLAERLRDLKQLDMATAIGERGLQLAGSKMRLGEWLGALEEAQGRTELALQAWLAALPENPSLNTYQAVKRLAGSKWSELRPEAMQALDKSYNKLPLAEVLLFEQEWDEAIKLAERDRFDYRVSEMVADAVILHRPEWVMNTSLKHAERLMVEVKSKNYPIAASWLKKAKKAYQQLGREAEWQAYLVKIKEQYKRRPALQAQLRQL
jgi:uncharacterized Zn finger protein